MTRQLTADDQQVPTEDTTGIALGDEPEVQCLWQKGAE